jgi:peptide/nickel transport system substrate-binding protein
MGLPVGGGAYMASNASGNPATKSTEFKSNNIVYYERNPYFYTLGIDNAEATQADLDKSASEADTALNNAKIKYIRYKVVSSSYLLDSLKNGEIDYSSDISAKQENINAIKKYSSTLSYTLQANDGYGYIGINPKYVQDIEVRRLLMYAFDRQYITTNYYTDGLGSIIERPMTTNSWAYPKGATAYYTKDWFINHYKNDLTGTVTAS